MVAILGINRPHWFREMETFNSEEDYFCISLATISQFFGTGTVLWNTAILLRIFLSIKYFQKGNSMIKSNYPFHIVVWGLTGILTLISFLMGLFGPNLVGCWFKERYSLTQLLCLSLPVILCMISSVVLLGLIMYYKRKLICDYVVHLPTLKRAKKEAHFDVLLMVYTFVFIGCWVPPVIVEFCNYFGFKSVVLGVVDAITLTLQGCGNAIVWGSLSAAIQNAINQKKQQNSVLQKQQNCEEE